MLCVMLLVLRHNIYSWAQSGPWRSHAYVTALLSTELSEQLNVRPLLSCRVNEYRGLTFEHSLRVVVMNIYVWMFCLAITPDLTK